MFIIKTNAELNKIITYHKKNGRVGFAPTMGALHKGHVSLIEESKKNCSFTVCSIFVNPTQFNDPKDLEKYPRPIEKDIDILEASGCNLLFLPDVAEIYPEGTENKKKFNFGQMDKVMEGFFRPGHFDGMAQVVDRLLEIVQPDMLFMGQKDFQQLTIVRAMLKLTNRPVKLVMCPTLREKDGLAISSRNVRLVPELRTKADILYKTLKWAKVQAPQGDLGGISKEAMKRIGLTGFKPEYFEFVDGYTLNSVNDIKNSNFIVACLACWVGEVRLIDNLIIKEPKD